MWNLEEHPAAQRQHEEGAPQDLEGAQEPGGLDDSPTVVMKWSDYGEKMRGMLDDTTIPTGSYGRIPLPPRKPR